MDLPAEPPQPPPLPATAPAPPPRLAPIFLAFLAAVVIGLAGTIVAAIIAAVWLSLLWGPENFSGRFTAQVTGNPLFVLAFMLPFEGALALVAVLAPRLERVPVRTALGFVPPRLRPSGWPLLLIGSAFPLALGIGAAYFLPSMNDAEGVTRMWKEMPPATAAIWVLTIGLAPGFCEEMFFRGFMQRRLLARLHPAAAIGVTSFAFALVHVDPPTMAMAFVLGLWLGFVAWRTGSIWPTIAIHATINSGWNLMQVIVRRADVSPTAIWTALGVFLAISLVCWAASLRSLAGRSPAAPGVSPPNPP